MPSTDQFEPFSTGELLLEIRAREAAMDAAADASPIGPIIGLEAIETGAIVAEVRTRQKVIYGVDNRQDAFSVNDPALLQDADAVVSLVNPSDLTNNGNGTSTLATTNFQTAYNLCATEPFAAQPTVAFCSGFLVAPDIVATAGHCVDAASVANTRFVFGFRMQTATAAQTTLANSEVYSGTSLVGRVLNGADWALVRLDRSVPNHTPVRIRRAGKIANGQAVHVIGHPAGLPLKIAGGANVRDNAPTTFFSANLDTYGGNSGSPVFNAATHEVEGILVRGETDFVMNGACRVSNVCPNNGCGGEDVTRTTEFAGLVPTTGPVQGAPALIQSTFGHKDNFELVAPSANGGLDHYWRNNDVSTFPWFPPAKFGGQTRYQAATLIQSNFGPGNLEVVAQSGDVLDFFWRTTGPGFTWSTRFTIARGVSGNPALIQSSFGRRGNFELVAPMASGGIGHFWRDNDNPSFPWRGPAVFGAGTKYDAVTMIRSNFGPGNLEVIARAGSRLDFFWRSGAPAFAWSGPFPIADGARGVPSLIQSSFGVKDNFELIVPMAAGGLRHYWRNNDANGLPWVPGVTLAGSRTYDAATLIQSNFGPGNLELIASAGGKLDFFWRTTGPGFTWSGPFAI